MEPSVWGYNWATLFLGNINKGIWPSRLEAGLTTLQGKKFIVAKSKKVKTGWQNVSEFVLPMMMDAGNHVK
jgi:hypothetical protein